MVRSSLTVCNTHESVVVSCQWVGRPGDDLHQQSEMGVTSPSEGLDVSPTEGLSARGLLPAPVPEGLYVLVPIGSLGVWPLKLGSRWSRFSLTKGLSVIVQERPVISSFMSDR